MRTMLWTILAPILLGCVDSTKKILGDHQNMVGDISYIQNITTQANCVGPQGPYTTATKSSFSDDYLLFLQDYSYKPNPFYALIINKKEGYGLDTLLSSQGNLSEAVIAVLKAHEFHEMMLQPTSRYSGFKQLQDTLFFGQMCEQIIASDHLGLPVRLYFDKITNLMAGISQLNPYKKGEVIRVHFEGWFLQERIKLFHTVKIKQGETDEYLFEYQNITINDPEFDKLIP